MIQLFQTATGYAPILVCDHCGKRIEDAKLALAVAPFSGKYPNGNRRILHAHKRSCFDAIERKEGEKCSWEELSIHIRLLAENVTLSPQELEKQQNVDSEWGINR